jgi:DNA-binding response OmpR family regulator
MDVPSGGGMSATNGAPQTASVLIVEDEPDTRDSLAMLLRRNGHTVRVAADANTALQLVDESPPHVVLIDIGLPGINGYEFARELRKRQLDHRPILIATTGFGTNEARQAASEAGIDLHFVKPVDPASLSILLNHLPQIARYVSFDGMADGPPRSATSQAEV